MKKLPFLLFLLFLLVGCSAQPNSEAEVRFQVQADSKDFISWNGGGGIEGHWSGTKLSGDGTLTFSNSQPAPDGLETPEDKELDPKSAQKILQEAVNAGLFDLKNIPSQEADGSYIGIEAEIDGHKISVSQAISLAQKGDPKWQAVMKVLAQTKDL